MKVDLIHYQNYLREKVEAKEQERYEESKKKIKEYFKEDEAEKERIGELLKKAGERLEKEQKENATREYLEEKGRQEKQLKDKIYKKYNLEPTHELEVERAYREILDGLIDD